MRINVCKNQNTEFQSNAVLTNYKLIPSFFYTMFLLLSDEFLPGCKSSPVNYRNLPSVGVLNFLFNGKTAWSNFFLSFFLLTLNALFLLFLNLLFEFWLCDDYVDVDNEYEMFLIFLLIFIFFIMLPRAAAVAHMELLHALFKKWMILSTREAVF